MDGSAGLRLPWPPFSPHPVPSASEPQTPHSSPLPRTPPLFHAPLVPRPPFPLVLPRFHRVTLPFTPALGALGSVSGPFFLTTWPPAFSPPPPRLSYSRGGAAPASSHSRPPHHHHRPPVDPAVSLLPGGVSTGGSVRLGISTLFGFVAAFRLGISTLFGFVAALGPRALDTTRAWRTFFFPNLLPAYILGIYLL